MNEFLTAILIIFGLTLFSWFTFFIYVIIDKDNEDILDEGCNKIYTIGDIFKSMKWRILNTSVGDAFSMPIIINWAVAVGVWALIIVNVISVCIIKIITILNVKSFIIRIKNYISNIFTNINNIRIFNE